ncbi:MAG: Molybdopterin Mo-transferase [Candidatus Alkanophagales archaeon MCA70_species_2]|nr:Molybdopterin Mo-transferase [Candidatus Alkanophaga liquidiphilum]
MKRFLEVKDREEVETLIWPFAERMRAIKEVSLGEALGRVLAADVRANRDVPPFDRAAMDGYAVRASDTFYADEERPVTLKVVGAVHAGELPKLEVRSGECVEIATGAPMPSGADAVVMVEFTELENDEVKIYKAVAPGENVMAAGSDIKRGELVLKRGTLLRPRDLGVLAACGISKIQVFKKPRVAVISTGNELLEPGEPLKPGKIYDVNSQTLSAAVSESGGVPLFLGILGDEPNALLKTLRHAVGSHDAVIISGGTSAGASDILYEVLDELGEILVYGVNIKPGKPFIFAVVENKPVFGLPGHPTSAIITFSLFVAPLLRRASGLPPRKPARVIARLSARIFSEKGRHEYVLVKLVEENGDLVATPILKGSGAITTLANADGYVLVDAQTEIVEGGEAVEVSLLTEKFI